MENFMNRNAYHQVLAAIVILLAILACVLPGQAPAAGPNTIETAIAGTSQAAAHQTSVAALFTPTPEGPTGTLIEQAPDGTTKYTDYDAGFEVTFPIGWLAVRPNSAEFNAALVGEGAVNSMLHEQMAADLKSDSMDYLLYGYILRPDIKEHVIFGFSKMKWDPEDEKMLDNANMGDLIRDLESQTTIPGFHVDTAQIHDDTNTRVVEVGGRWTLNDGTSDPVPFYSTVYFFKPTPTSIVRITITFVQDYQDELAADVNSIKDTIKIIER
jgi:hypothetical protein